MLLSGAAQASLLWRSNSIRRPRKLGPVIIFHQELVCQRIMSSFSSDGEITVAASVATGFENVAASEVIEKLGFTVGSKQIRTSQGRVYFKTRKESLATIHKLRSVDRLFLVIHTEHDYLYKDSKEGVYDDLTKMARDISWSEVVKVWDCNKPFCKPKGTRHENLSKKRRLNDDVKAKSDTLLAGDVPSVSEVPDSAREESYDPVNESEPVTPDVPTTEIDERVLDDSQIPLHSSDGTLIRFRVTANRVGKKQPITSPEASYRFGGEIQDITKWKVDLSDYNLEVMLCLGEKSLEVTIALTLQSLHRRNISHFGVTTLRATTAYSMLRMSDIKAGEIVIDPMCGSGAIPVEGALEWPCAFHVGGDDVHAAITRYHSNIQFLKDNPEFSGCKVAHATESKRRDLRTDVVRWDVRNLPVKTSHVDVVVSDLPFGKRMGSKLDNRKLYPALLSEMARITRCETGRACLLTQDKRTLKRALDALSQYWKLKTNIYINIGGLTAGVFLLQRTGSPFVPVPLDDAN